VSAANLPVSSSSTKHDVHDELQRQLLEEKKISSGLRGEVAANLHLSWFDDAVCTKYAVSEVRTHRKL